MLRFFNQVTKNVLQTTEQPRVLTPAQQALSKVVELHQEGKLREALWQIEKVESEYPSCSKAAKYYRGKIGMELLVKEGHITPEEANSPSFTGK